MELHWQSSTTGISQIMATAQRGKWKIVRILLYFGNLLGTYCLHMVISEIVSLKSGDFRGMILFRKILCMSPCTEFFFLVTK
jgi:hypothetical protein